MRKSSSRLLAFLIAVTVLWPLSGCGQSPAEEMHPDEPDQLYFSKTVYPFSADTEIESMARSGSQLFLIAKKGEQTLFGAASYMLAADGEGHVEKAELLTPEPTDLGEDPVWYGLCADRQENLWLLLGDRDGDGVSSRLVLQKYLPNGTFFSSVEIRDWAYQSVDVFAVGPEGEIGLLLDNTVAVYSRDGELLFETEKQGWNAESLFVTEEGLVLSSIRRNRDSGSTEAMYERIDPDTGALIPWEHTTPETADSSLQEVRDRGGRLSACQGLDDELLVNDGNAIYLLPPDPEPPAELIVWNRERSLNRSADSACRLGSSSFAALLNGELILSWARPDEGTDAGLVRVAVFGSGYELLVLEANSRSAAYRYEAQVFSTTDKVRLAAEIAQGSFDLLLLDGGINTSSNLFLDLYPLLDADPELSREDFLPHLLDSCELHGELHQIWNCVSIYTMAAPEALIPSYEGLTLSDCDRIVSESEDFFSVWYSMDQDMIAREYPVMMANLALAVFVDKETGTCSFDSDEFRELLAWCGSVKPSAQPDTPPLLSTLMLCSAKQLDMIEQSRFPLTITGIPNDAQGLSYYTMNSARGRGCTMAIPANSRNKEGAWAFIREMLSDESQHALAKQDGMPVLTDVLRDVNTSAPQRAQEQLDDLLERTRWSQYNFDEELIKLIVSECQPYMRGERSLDETVKMIQSRASIYVAEKYT